MHPTDEDDSKRRVLVTGATGLVGCRLLPRLSERFDAVRTLSRSGPILPSETGPGSGSTLEACRWDGVDPGSSALDGVDAVIHLAGEPIFGGFPTAARRGRMRASRIDSTRRLVDRMLERPSEDRPATLVCASAVGIYGDRGEEWLDESASLGTGFLADICRDWESEAERACDAGIRVVRMRIGVVLSSEGGALGLMKIPFKLGLGGRLGSGQQFLPWIQLGDLVRSILFCLEEPIEGPVNAVAPEAVRNIEFTRALARTLGRPAFLPVPGFVLRALLGEISGELLGSRRVAPAKLEDSGFSFLHPELRSALEAELG